MVRAYTSKTEAESRERITLTYVNALWHAQWMGGKKRPPSLKELLSTKNKTGMTEKKPAMSDEQMLNTVRQLNAAFGGEVRISDE